MRIQNSSKEKRQFQPAASGRTSADEIKRHKIVPDKKILSSENTSLQLAQGYCLVNKWSRPPHTSRQTIPLINTIRGRSPMLSPTNGAVCEQVAEDVSDTVPHSPLRAFVEHFNVTAIPERVF